MKHRLGYLSGAPRVSTHPDAEMSGPRAHVLGIINGFEALGWQVTPYIVGDRVPKSWNAKGSEKAIQGNSVRTLAVDFVRIGMGIKNARQAFRELGQQVDYVYERFGTFQAMGRPFRRAGIPWILETNAILFEESKLERKTLVLSDWARQAELRAYRECDVLVCISEALKAKVVSVAQIDPHKVIVVPNGVDVDLINPDRYPAKRLFDGFTLGFVGSLAPWQGLDLLLEVLHQIKQERGIVINLAVVGDGPMQHEWESLTQSLELRSQVKFAGRFSQPELFHLIAGFDAGFSGHLDIDGKAVYRSPLKLYEYMAMAKPVVASVVEDSQMLIRPGENGFVFLPGDKPSLYDALISAYEAHERLSQMGLAARQEVVAHHSWAARVAALMQQVETLKLHSNVA